MYIALNWVVSRIYTEIYEANIRPSPIFGVVAGKKFVCHADVSRLRTQTGNLVTHTPLPLSGHPVASEPFALWLHKQVYGQSRNDATNDGGAFT